MLQRFDLHNGLTRQGPQADSDLMRWQLLWCGDFTVFRGTSRWESRG